MASSKRLWLNSFANAKQDCSAVVFSTVEHWVAAAAAEKKHKTSSFDVVGTCKTHFPIMLDDDLFSLLLIRRFKGVWWLGRRHQGGVEVRSGFHPWAYLRRKWTLKNFIRNEWSLLRINKRSVDIYKTETLVSISSCPPYFSISEEDFTQQLWAHSKIFLMNICEVEEDSMGFLVFA